jgi:A118 family predicted phage portal protein
MTFTDILKRLGRNPPSDGQYAAISLWEQWYRGKVASFHNYRIYNGSATIRRERAQLNMAKTGCETWAGLLWNDECFVTIEDDDRAQRLIDAALKGAGFDAVINAATETAFALGAGAVVVYGKKENLVIETSAAPNVFPLAWRGRDVTACAFGGSLNTKTGKLLYLMLHEYESSGWRVRNMFFSENGAEVPPPDGIEPEYKTAVRRFALIRPNIVNNLDPASPFGLSVYANAIDALKSIDLAFDGVNVSMMIGRPRIAASVRTLKVGVDGVEDAFDANDIVFYQLPESTDDDKTLITDITTQYRAGDFETSLKTALSLYAQMIGLGENTFRFDKGSVQTATQVISDNQTMLRAVARHQNALAVAVTDVVMAVADVLGLNINRDQVSVHFDDSVTRDKAAEKQHALLLVAQGIIPKWYYLVEFEGYDEKEAKALAAEAAGGEPEETPEEAEGT